MARPLSPAEEIRRLRTLIRALRKKAFDADSRAVHVAGDRDNYRARATRAEQEVAEWRKRFDLLLAAVKPASLDEKTA